MEQPPVLQSHSTLAELRITLAAIDTQIWRTEIKAMVIAYVTITSGMSLVSYSMVPVYASHQRFGILGPIVVTILFLLAALVSAFLCFVPRLGSQSAVATRYGVSVLDAQQIGNFGSPTEYLERIGGDLESVERVRNLYCEQIWIRSKTLYARKVPVILSMVFLGIAIVFSLFSRIIGSI